MKEETRVKRVRFVDEKLYEAFKKLESGKSEDQLLAVHLKQAIENLKKDPYCGLKVRKNLWPKEYVQKYAVTNLWKYNLPGAWRLIYTLVGNEVEVISVLLEWFDHKEYEKRFNYK